MADSLRVVKNRIKSVDGISRLTGAMKLVSASKLKALQKELALSVEYFLRLEGLFKNVLSDFRASKNEFLRARPGKQNVLVYVITSDTGLCGIYNNAVMNYAEKFINNGGFKNVSLIPIGEKGLRHFKKKGFNVINSYVDLYGHYSDAAGGDIVKNMIDMFLNKKTDEIYVAYTNYITSARHRPIVEKILSIEPPPVKEIGHMTEPDIESILENLIPLYISGRIKNIMLNAFASEHAMRVIAMSEATDNAQDLVEALVLLRNKMRQASITTELIEVVSSMNAMKG